MFIINLLQNHGVRLGSESAGPQPGISRACTSLLNNRARQGRTGASARLLEGSRSSCLQSGVLRNRETRGNGSIIPLTALTPNRLLGGGGRKSLPEAIILIDIVLKTRMRGMQIDEIIAKKKQKNFSKFIFQENKENERRMPEQPDRL